MPSRCKYCGKFISNTANFCSCCGAPINQQNAEKNYNSDYQRIIICPHCHSQLKNSDELLKYETIQCLNCKNTFENPYYDHKNISKGVTSSQKRNLACFFIAIN